MNGGPPVLSVEQLVTKEKELASRAADLARREREVRVAIARTTPNFPPSFLCVSPMVYHSIPNEVPADRQVFVQRCYYCYYFTVGLIIYNIIAAAAGLFSPDKAGAADENWASHFGFSFVYLIGVPGAFITWYYPLYRATSSGERGKYLLTYLGLVLAIAFDAFMAIGIVGYGGCGWMYVIAARDNKSSAAAEAMGIISAALWTMQGFFFAFVIYRVRQYSTLDATARADATATAPRPGAAI